jgi:translation initiation factor IF-2
MRLHELAKKLGVSSKELMDACRAEGFEVKSHFKAVTPEIIFAMNKSFGGRSAARVEVDEKPARARARAAATPAKAATKPAAKAAAKPKETKAPVPMPKSKSRKVVKRLVPQKPEEGEGDEEKQETPHHYVDHHAHRPKRANFKSRPTESILPTEPSISQRYDDVLGGGGRQGGGRRRRRKRPNVKQLAARAEAGLLTATGAARSGGGRHAVKSDAPIELTPPMTPRDLSSAIGIKLENIIKFLIQQGIMASINEPLGADLIELIALENSCKVTMVEAKTVEDKVVEEFAAERDEEKMESRPPVIAFLGHVDHGKTSLLDYIRQSRVVDTESGGITQHVGAYQLQLNDQTICFLDTPGHEAFSSMRARGADMTDIVVLVVAADDGVMPQTKEAYAHAKAAGTPVVVAINKCDLPNANPQKAMQELSGLDEGLLPEDWGGSAGMVQVSAITGDGVEDLLERILLEAEMMELKAEIDASAEGHVLEAKMTEGQGVTANVLVEQGTLNRGDVILCGQAFGRVRSMFDDQGQTMPKAGPSTPVSLTGLSEMPEAGDRMMVLGDLSKAREVAAQRAAQARTDRLRQRSHVSLENLTEYLKTNAVKALRVVLKADVVGTLEVLKKTLDDLATDEVKIDIIHSGVGGINSGDIILADASDAVVLGFHVAADQGAKVEAEKRSVQFKIYHVIYRIVEDMKASLSGLLPPEEREVITGHIEIRQVFKVSRLGNIAGSYVQDGVVTRTSRVRIFRDNVMIYEGRLASLQRFKDQVKEVREGYECGLRMDGYDNVQVGDILEAYTTEEIERTLE